MKHNKFDIVMADFPFTNLLRAKKRPILIIKPLEGENNIACQITTKKRHISKYEIELKKEECGGDIRFDSNIYIDMIFTLHESITYEKIGFITNDKIKKQIEEKLQNLFLN